VRSRGPMASVRVRTRLPGSSDRCFRFDRFSLAGPGGRCDLLSVRSVTPRARRKSSRPYCSMALPYAGGGARSGAGSDDIHLLWGAHEYRGRVHLRSPPRRSVFAAPFRACCAPSLRALQAFLTPFGCSIHIPRPNVAATAGVPAIAAVSICLAGYLPTSTYPTLFLIYLSISPICLLFSRAFASRGFIRGDLWALLTARTFAIDRSRCRYGEYAELPRFLCSHYPSFVHYSFYLCTPPHGLYFLSFCPSSPSLFFLCLASPSLLLSSSSRVVSYDPFFFLSSSAPSVSLRCAIECGSSARGGRTHLVHTCVTLV